jgi:integral membrane protein
VDITNVFRKVALAEATSFLALLLATIIKYSADAPQGVKVLGPIHGALFLGYVALLLFVRVERQWGLLATLLVFIGAVIPFGGYAVERWMSRTDTKPAVS